MLVSQYLGSGANFESQQMYKHTLAHCLALYKAKPSVIIADKHPDYFTHQYAIELGKRYGAPVEFVQHHEAHFAAILAESHLLPATNPVLGVIWDGTGLGTDGNIWGGEFFTYQNKAITRFCHFAYYPCIAGNNMAQQPRIAALCAAQQVWLPLGQLKHHFTTIEWNNYQALLQAPGLLTSSVGRLFDAVASLLDVCHTQSYEGEAAMKLANLAEDYVNQHGFTMHGPYVTDDASNNDVSTTAIIQGVILDIYQNQPINFIAARFHYSLVCVIDAIAKRAKVNQICFSGGVFQNMLLVDWITHALSDKYQLHFHQNLSPNDENISFGQMVYHHSQLKSGDKPLSVNHLIAQSVV